MELKKLFLGLLLASVTFGQVSAQTFRFGLEAGGGISNFSGADAKNLSGSLSSRIGLVGGLFLQLNFGDSFAIQPEVLYAQKGSQTTSGSNNSTFDLSYVEIPVLLKLYLPTPGIKPNIFAGGAVGFNTAANLVASGTPSAIANISSSDVGVIGGVGVDIDKFSISGRYELGLTKVSTSTTGSDIQNGTISVMLGYSFM